MSAFDYEQDQLDQTDSYQVNNIGINYIIISPIESYLPKDYVKMILDETFCQIDLDGSAFVANKKDENINTNDESNIYYVGIMKVNRWHNTDMANQLIDHLICDMPFQMSEYGWTIEKYNPSDSDDEELENVDMEFLESNSLPNSDNIFDDNESMSSNNSYGENYDLEEFDD